MLRKIIILEIIAVIAVGVWAYRVYGDYQSAFTKNQDVKDRLIEVRLEEAKTYKEYDELNNEMSALRDSIDTKILEVWKRRVQQLQEELE